MGRVAWTCRCPSARTVAWPPHTTTAGTTGGFDRSLADCYNMIRETKVKVDVPDHKGSMSLCDENLEWYRKVRNHLKGSHKDVQAVLEKIEGRRTEIQQHELDNAFGMMIDLDCNQLSAAVYHMLNGLLTGEAHK